MKLADRPYDIAMSDELRAAVRERRQNPDGKKLPVRIEMRGKTEVMTYPWASMKLGDFFFVPLRGQRPGPLSVRFRQVAARKDWELTIVQQTNGTEPSIRVCLTLLDVSQIKAKAQQHHAAKCITYSDGRWAGTRKARYLRTKGSPKLKMISNPLEEIKEALEEHADRMIDGIRSGKIPIIVAEPQQPPVEQDATLSSGYDREKVLRERLAALGIGAKS